MVIKLHPPRNIASTELYIRLSPLQYSTGTRHTALVASVESIVPTGEDEIRLKRRSERQMSFFIVVPVLC